MKKSKFQSRQPIGTHPAGRTASNDRSSGIPQRFSGAILLGLVLLLGGALNRAQAATLEGTVFDPSGRAVSGARVSLLQLLSPLDQRQTNAEGNYKFEGFPPGTYQLVASAPGLSASQAGVEVRQGQAVRMDLHLSLSAVEQQVVVSAALGAALVPQIGSSVSVVSQQEIEDRGADSVLEVLRGIPGVEVNQSGPYGGVTGVFVRGGDSDYNLVMVDGIQLNEFGGDFDFAPLPADGVDHVEVTRGPESALYGSNAVTSVVNIVSKHGDGPPHFTAQAEGGSYDTWHVATGGSGLTDGLSWAYSLSRMDFGGVVPNDWYVNQSASANLSYSKSLRRQASFHFFGDANDAGDPGPYGSDPDDLYPGIDTISRNKQNLFGYQGSYTEQFSSRFRQVATASAATNDYYFISPYGNSYSNTLRGVVNTRSEIAVSNQDFLVAGFEYNREEVENTYIANADSVPFVLPRTSLAYFAENRWTPSNNLFINAGVRLDDIQTHALPPGDYGVRPLLPASTVVKLNPRLSAAYLARATKQGEGFGATRFHASFGTGIRAPDGFDLAFTNNPHLLPERSISVDSGVEQRFLADRGILDLTYFYNRFKDQIVVLGGSLTNLSSFISANLANSRAEGLEASLRLRPTRSLQLTGEYTVLDSAILALNGATEAQFPFQVGQPLIRRPRNSGAYNLTWRRGRLMLNTNAYIRGKALDVEPNLGTGACLPPPDGPGLPCLFENKGYIRADGGFSYTLLHGVEIYGRLDNFLDRHYEEAFGYPDLPLNFLAGIKFQFPRQ